MTGLSMMLLIIPPLCLYSTRWWSFWWWWWPSPSSQTDISPSKCVSFPHSVSSSKVLKDQNEANFMNGWETAKREGGDGVTRNPEMMREKKGKREKEKWGAHGHKSRKRRSELTISQAFEAFTTCTRYSPKLEQLIEGWILHWMKNIFFFSDRLIASFSCDFIMMIIILLLSSS